MTPYGRHSEESQNDAPGESDKTSLDDAPKRVALTPKILTVHYRFTDFINTVNFL